MSNKCVEDNQKQWDYLCPQFCDFNATETTDQLKQMDHFFEVDHELEEQKSFYGEEVVPLCKTPVIECKSQLSEAVDDFNYETPPQNKENEEEDNDVFYSTKKYLSEKKKYKFRSTPMRTLQHNGSTPLRETRISSKKKKNRSKPNFEFKKVGEESLFTMQTLLKALPNQYDSPSISNECQLGESTPFEDNQSLDKIGQNINELDANQQNEQLIENDEQNEIEDQVFESVNESSLPTKTAVNTVPDRRKSYVIENNRLDIESADNEVTNKRESYVVENNNYLDTESADSVVTNKRESYVVENNIHLESESADSVVTNKRESYVVENNNYLDTESADSVVTNKRESYVVENNNYLDTESADSVVTNKRESYVVENNNHLETESAENAVPDRSDSYVVVKPTKTVTVVSPIKSSKTCESTKKRFTNSIRRKGTPIRKSILNSGRKVSSQSIVSRLYSAFKKSNNEYKSMAELLKEFETNPRSCDRSRPFDRAGSSQRSRSSSVSSLTQPKSPKLHSIYRHRPTPRQTEDIIASQIKKYSFKANPIRKKLFNANTAIAPKVRSSKAPTKALPINFVTEKRCQMWATKHSNSEDNAEVDRKFKANPMPTFKSPKVSTTKSEKKGTAFKPFSFDERIQQLVTKKRTQSENESKKDVPRNTFKY